MRSRVRGSCHRHIVGVADLFQGAQAKRDGAHRAACAPFERDLPMGMARIDVESYFDSPKVDYCATGYGGRGTDTRN